VCFLGDRSRIFKYSNKLYTSPISEQIQSLRTFHEEYIRVLTQVTFQQIFVQQPLLKNVFAGPDNDVVTGNRGPNHNNLLASLICHFTAINDSKTESTSLMRKFLSKFQFRKLIILLTNPFRWRFSQTERKGRKNSECFPFVDFLNKEEFF
jgi:hypothetical protein